MLTKGELNGMLGMLTEARRACHTAENRLDTIERVLWTASGRSNVDELNVVYIPIEGGDG